MTQHERVAYSADVKSGISASIYISIRAKALQKMELLVVSLSGSRGLFHLSFAGRSPALTTISRRRMRRGLAVSFLRSPLLALLTTPLGVALFTTPVAGGRALRVVFNFSSYCQISGLGPRSSRSLELPCFASPEFA